MPALLREHQLELLNANDETQALLFGTEDTGYLTLKPPLWRAGDTRDGDVDRPNEDGRYFGPDRRGGASVGFEIGVLTDRYSVDADDPYEANVDYVDALQSWWDDEDLRTNPWDLAVLRTCVAGRVWRAYGRPRRFDAVPDRLQQQGYTPVICDFDVADNRVYADEEQSMDLSLVIPPTGGLVAPLVAPLTGTGETEGQKNLVITGSRATWLCVDFHGPVSNPSVEIVIGNTKLVIGLATSIPDGLTVTFDPRPWSRGVTRGDGANYAGYISVATGLLSEMRIRKGTYPVTYRGTDATGTSSATLRWRPARSRP